MSDEGSCVGQTALRRSRATEGVAMGYYSLYSPAGPRLRLSCRRFDSRCPVTCMDWSPSTIRGVPTWNAVSTAARNSWPGAPRQQGRQGEGKGEEREGSSG